MLTIILIILALILLLFLVTVVMLFNGASKREGSKLFKLVVKPKKADDSLKKIKETEKIWFATIPQEELEITSFDGLKLKATLLLHPEAERTILCIHGYRGHGVGDFVTVARLFYEHKCNLLMPDHRASGQSEGKYISFGYNERFDIKDWTFVLENRFPQLPIYFDGVSMGCHTALLCSDLAISKNVKGIIADCGYTSTEEELKHVLKTAIKLPSFPLLNVFGLITQIVAKYKINELSTVDAMKHSKLPILFAHGTSDTFVPPEMTKENFKACTSKKELLLVEGATHGMSVFVDKQSYQEKIFRLFDYCEGRTENFGN